MKYVCEATDVAEGKIKGFDVDGERVLIINGDNGFRASTGVCPHQEVLLEEGLFDGCVLTCHSHLWQWDVETGDAQGLAEGPLEMYQTKVEDGKVYITIPK